MVPGYRKSFCLWRTWIRYNVHNFRLILVHVWDVRGSVKPVSSNDVGLGMDDVMVTSTQFIGDELLSMNDRRLVSYVLGTDN